MKKLVIVESPAKAKTIGSVLGRDYIVRASLGHVRDLPNDELGVDVEHNFKPTYHVLRAKSKTIKQLREHWRRRAKFISPPTPIGKAKPSPGICCKCSNRRCPCAA